MRNFQTETSNIPEVDYNKFVELADPLIYEDENGKELLSPVIFYRPKTEEELAREATQTIEGPKLMADEVCVNEVFDLTTCKKISSTRSVVKANIGVDKMKINGRKALKESNEILPNPFETMRELIAMVPVKSLKNNLYVYNGVCYELTTKIDVGKLVTEKFEFLVSLIGKTKYITEVVDFLLFEPNCVIREDDIAKNLVSFKNTTLNLANGLPIGHSPSYLTFNYINADYLPYDPQTPYFDAFLNSISGGDIVLIERILQFIGYVLTPDTSAKVYFLLQGVSDSGKSTLAELIQDLFSDGSTTGHRVQELGEKFSISDLVGKSLCVFNDMPAESLSSASVSQIKQITGNDKLSSAVKYGSGITFRSNIKLIFVTNHPFMPTTKDDAFLRRAVTIPFKYSFAKQQQDFNLKDKLLLERDGIVKKAMQAYFRLVQNKYVFAGDYAPNEVVMNDQAYAGDPKIKIFRFLQQHFIVDGHNHVFTDEAYNQFVNQFGYISMNEFSHHFAQLAVEAFGAKRGRKRRKGETNPISCVLGIAFKYNDSNIAEV